MDGSSAPSSARAPSTDLRASAGEGMQEHIDASSRVLQSVAFALAHEEPCATRVEIVPFAWHRGEVAAA